MEIDAEVQCPEWPFAAHKWTKRAVEPDSLYDIQIKIAKLATRQVNDTEFEEFTNLRGTSDFELTSKRSRALS